MAWLLKPFFTNILFVAAILLLAAVVLQADFSKAIAAASPWMNPMITREEFAALDWVRNNTRPREKFMACIFEGEMLMGHALREATEGGDWAVVPGVVQQMQDVSDFFNSGESKKAWELGVKYGAFLAWVPKRDQFCGFSWSKPNAGAFSDPKFFEKIFSNDKLEVYELKQDPFKYEKTRVIPGAGAIGG